MAERKDGPARPAEPDEDAAVGDEDGSSGTGTTGPVAYALGKVGRTLIGQLRQLPIEFKGTPATAIGGRISKADQLAAKERKQAADTLAQQRASVAQTYFRTYLDNHITAHLWVVTPACSLHILPSTLATVIIPELIALLAHLPAMATPLSMSTLPPKLTPNRLPTSHIYRFTSLAEFNLLSAYGRECQRLERVREGLAERVIALDALRSGKTLMATDLEANEFNPAIILELGCSFIVPPESAATSTKSLFVSGDDAKVTAAGAALASSSSSSSTGSTSAAIAATSAAIAANGGGTGERLADASSWRVMTTHYIVAEQAHHVNKRWVAGCPDKFNFGTSAKLLLADVTRYGIADLSRIQCLVGHSLHHDVKYLRTLGVYSDAHPKIMIDTQKLNDSLLAPAIATGLEKQLIYHNIQPAATNLHNAGNDSHYTALLMLAQLAAVPAPMPPPVETLPGPPVQPILIDEELVLIAAAVAATTPATAATAIASK